MAQANPKFRVIGWAYLDYDNQVANFTEGRTITGDISECTANIFTDDDQGASGTLTIGKIVPGFGEFQNNEQITDDVTGDALVNGTIRYVEYVWDTLNLQPALPVSEIRDFFNFEHENRTPSGKLKAVANELDLRVWDCEWMIAETQVWDLMKWHERGAFWLYPDAILTERYKVEWIENEFQPIWQKGGKYRLTATLRETVQ